VRGICHRESIGCRGEGGGAGRGGGFAFHGGGFRGFHGFYDGGIYPYSLLGGYYPRYLYGSRYPYYPYSIDENDEPDCDFVWVGRTAKRKIVRRSIWTCF
jgi:hypothetical protein